MKIRSISDALLIEAYCKAIQYKVSEDFIRLLKEELSRRGISDKVNCN